MLDQNLKDQIQYAYKRMKHGRIKGFLLCWVIYVFMGGIVSLFLGNPFPHKESVFFFSIWDSGWIYTWADTRPYLLVIFTAAGMVLSSIGLSVMILRIWQRSIKSSFSSVMLQSIWRQWNTGWLMEKVLNARVFKHPFL